MQCCLDGDHEELARRVGGPEMPVPHNFKYRTVLARRAWLAARSGASVRNFDFEYWERYLEERRAAIKMSAARLFGRSKIRTRKIRTRKIYAGSCFKISVRGEDLAISAGAKSTETKV